MLHVWGRNGLTGSSLAAPDDDDDGGGGALFLCIISIHILNTLHSPNTEQPR
jgi:hypothetical protein